jgi:hypothetical protein
MLAEFEKFQIVNVINGNLVDHNMKGIESPGSREWSAHTQKSQLPCTGSHTGGVSALTPYGGHPSAHDSRGPGRRTLPRAAHPFLTRALEALG